MLRPFPSIPTCCTMGLRSSCRIAQADQGLFQAPLGLAGQRNTTRYTMLYHGESTG
jgi:hypothetical protein